MHKDFTYTCKVCDWSDWVLKFHVNCSSIIVHTFNSKEESFCYTFLKLQPRLTEIIWHIQLKNLTSTITKILQFQLTEKNKLQLQI